MAPAQRPERGQVGRLDQRVGGDLGDDAGDAAVVRREGPLDRGEVEGIADMDVVLRRPGEALQDRDGVEVEPAELEPDGAAARRLEGGGRAERRPDGVHAAGSEEQVGVGGSGERAAQLRADLRRGITLVEKLRVDRRQQSEAHQMVLGLAGGKESPGVLQVGLRAGGDFGGDRMREPMQAVAFEGSRPA